MYREEERGKFDVNLVRNDINARIAYTDYDVVRIDYNSYKLEDQQAVKDFAESYDLPVEW